MAPVRLADVFVDEVYASYTSVDNPETTAFYQAGIIATDPLLDAIAKGGGKTPSVPFWQDLDPSEEPNYSNDDPADEAEPGKIGTDTMTARKAFVNKGYSDMDLVQELAGASPMARIRNRFGTYWNWQLNRRLIATCVGLVADNVANDNGDMGNDISGLSGDDANFGSNAFIDAAYTMGDRVGQLTGIAVHSMIMRDMVKNDEIVYIPDSAGRLTIPTYKGRVVVVDDGLYNTGGVYTSILFGRGAIGFGGVEGSAFGVGEGIPRVPFELERNPRAGNGGGQEEIWERRTWLMHPFGFEWLEQGAALTEFSPTLADLRLGAHWNRVVSRKQVPIAWIKSKAS